MKQLILSCLAFISLWEAPLTALDQYLTVEEAAFYNHHSQQQWRVAFFGLQFIEFEGTEHILDIGCGSGKVTANMAGMLPYGSILGIDLSEGMIEFAQKTYQPFYQNLSFAKEDILSFSYPSQFDFVFSSSSLHWILDHKQLLNQVFILLRDGGRILFTIPSTPSNEVAEVIRDVVSEGPWQAYLKDYHHPRRKFTAGEYYTLLEQAGFSNIEVVQVPFGYHFENKREFADWYAAFSPILSYIPTKMHEAFLLNLVERYLESFPLDESGQVTFEQSELIIMAQKYVECPDD